MHNSCPLGYPVGNEVKSSKIKFKKSNEGNSTYYIRSLGKFKYQNIKFGLSLFHNEISNIFE